MIMQPLSHQKILLVSHGAVLDNSGYRRRVLNEIAILPRRDSNNSEITYTLLAFLSLKFFFRKNKEELRRYARESGFKPFLFVSIPSANLLPLLVLDTVLCLVQLAYVVKKQKITCIHAHNLFAGFICTLLKQIRLLRIPFVLDYHGVVPEEYREHYPSDTIGYGVRKFMERITIKNADYIICVSNYFKQYLTSDFNKSKKSISVVPSCINDQAFFHNEKTRKTMRQRIGAGNNVVLVYSGNIGIWHAHDRLLEIYRRIASTYGHIFLLFLIPSRKDGVTLQKKLNDLNFRDHFYKILHLEHNEVGRYLMAADVAFLVRKDSLVNRVASPTKFAEYLASGLPVFASAHIGDIEWYVSRNNIGVVCEHFNDSTIDTAFHNMLSILKGKDVKKQCIKTAKKHFIWKNFTDTIGKIYTSLHKIHSNH